MKEPRHRPGPEFDKAADAAEQRRQQRIATLTEQQRQDYEALQRTHRTKEQDRSHALKREHAKKLPDRMRGHLTAEQQPRPKPRGSENAPDTQQLKRMRHSVDDYLTGRNTQDTNAYALQLQNAEKKAKGEFRRETNTKLESLRGMHQKERDRFLERCEKKRVGEKMKAEFEKSGKDTTWQRAVQLAASRETDKEKETKLTNEFEKSR